MSPKTRNIPKAAGIFFGIYLAVQISFGSYRYFVPWAAYTWSIGIESLAAESSLERLDKLHEKRPLRLQYDSFTLEKREISHEEKGDLAL